MWSDLYPNEDYSIRDNVTGVVTKCRAETIEILLDNGQTAYAFFGANAPGERVLCTVLKKADERRDVKVSIDSILNVAPLAA